MTMKSAQHTAWSSHEMNIQARWTATHERVGLLSFFLAIENTKKILRNMSNIFPFLKSLYNFKFLSKIIITISHKLSTQ